MQVEEFLADIERRIANLIRIGTVVEVIGSKVKIQTANLITKPLPYLTQRSGDCITWWSPSIGEQVLILSQCGELNNGVVLPAIPTKEYQTKEQTKHIITYADGTSISYDYENKKLDINAVGEVKIKATKIILDANTEVTKGLIAKDDIKAGNISVQGHAHVDAEGRKTSTSK